jgi:hypothetical protein
MVDRAADHIDAVVTAGSARVSAAGVSTNDVRVYKNTLVGVQHGACSIRMPGTHRGVTIANTCGSASRSS